MSTIDAPLPAAPSVPGPAPHLLVVRAPYYREVVDGMTRGAERILGQAGARHDVLDVAGAFELPQAIRLALRGTTRFDGFVALGCVVKGETDHYEFLCREAMAGLMNVALQFGLAMGSGLLTVHTIEQALARSSDDGHNKGAEAAAAALLQIKASRTVGAH
ncbi:MAG: 6,7-dimethyl-8-ribityllumazine synthase [Acetobacteraceae bacterium]|nr:6,7-dimethyl-8-ribityllumazine synthase [Acetobacteraceae bacterium]